MHESDESLTIGDDGLRTALGDIGGGPGVLGSGLGNSDRMPHVHTQPPTAVYLNGMCRDEVKARTPEQNWLNPNLGSGIGTF